MFTQTNIYADELFGEGECESVGCFMYLCIVYYHLDVAYTAHHSTASTFDKHFVLLESKSILHIPLCQLEQQTMKSIILVVCAWLTYRNATETYTHTYT